MHYRQINLTIVMYSLRPKISAADLVQLCTKVVLSVRQLIWIGGSRTFPNRVIGYFFSEMRCVQRCISSTPIQIQVQIKTSTICQGSKQPHRSWSQWTFSLAPQPCPYSSCMSWGQPSSGKAHHPCWPWHSSTLPRFYLRSRPWSLWHWRLACSYGSSEQAAIQQLVPYRVHNKHLVSDQIKPNIKWNTWF